MVEIKSRDISVGSATAYVTFMTKPSIDTLTADFELRVYYNELQPLAIAPANLAFAGSHGNVSKNTPGSPVLKFPLPCTLHAEVRILNVCKKICGPRPQNQ